MPAQALYLRLAVGDFYCTVAYLLGVQQPAAHPFVERPGGIGLQHP